MGERGYGERCVILISSTALVFVCSRLAVVAKYDVIKPGGSLTLTSGTGAITPGTTASIGGGLNAGLFTMTHGLANELKVKKIRVNCQSIAQGREEAG